MVIELRIGKQVDHRASRSGARLGSPPHHAGHACVQDGPGAHGAGLQRHIERAVFQPVVAHMLRRIAQRLYFCMGAGVVQPHRPIASPANDEPPPHHNRPHRHFASLGSRLRLLQGNPHPVRVVFS